MTPRYPSAPCAGPLVYAAENLSIYHANEEPKEGQEHSHDDLQITLPLGGSIQARWETAAGHRRHQPVPPGALIAYPSGQPHGVQVREETELAALWLPAPFVTRTARDLTMSGAVEIHEARAVQDGLLQHLCLSLLTEARQDARPARLYVDAMANLLAVHLIRHYSTARPVSLRQDGLSRNVLRRVTEYVDAHLERDVSLADLAAAACLSESRFSHLFRHSTGTSPYQYVLVQRIERAKRLLRAGSISVGEVALRVGFCDQSQFTRQFKKLTGLTPKAFALDTQR